MSFLDDGSAAKNSPNCWEAAKQSTFHTESGYEPARKVMNLQDALENASAGTRRGHGFSARPRRLFADRGNQFLKYASTGHTKEVDPGDPRMAPWIHFLRLTGPVRLKKPFLRPPRGPSKPRNEYASYRHTRFGISARRKGGKLRQTTGKAPTKGI